jgi:outer membrane protein OmpA-like peptidoglycan-associated protein
MRSLSLPRSLCWVAPALVGLLPATVAAQSAPADPPEIASASSDAAAAPAPGDAPSPYAPEAGMTEFGVFGGLFIPSKNHELYDYDNSRHAPFKGPGLDVGLRLAYFPASFFGLELEGAVMPNKAESGASALIWSARGHAIAQLPGRFTPFLVAGGGLLGVSSKEDALGSDLDGAFHYGVGFKWFATRTVALRLDGRHVLSNGFDGATVDRAPLASHFEALLGLSLAFGRSSQGDEDGDGILDGADRCPEVPSQEPDGCPLADSDRDGIPDKSDQCVTEPGVAPSGCPDKDGDGFLDKDEACDDEPSPKNGGCPQLDSDGDGKTDDVDACPKEAGNLDDGCPDLDPDRDGIPAGRDKCPSVAGMAPHGCGDADADGVPDQDDKCQTKPESKNGYQDQDGCPDQLPKAVKKFTGAIKGINFATGSARIEPSSFSVLDGAVGVLKDFADVKVEISGHTDDRGRTDDNKQLSQDRADSVKAYFVEKGLDGARFTTKGYGPDFPVATNKTAAGRAKNRRIEFRLLTEE